MEKRAPREMSGGQQQRVALARALVNRPRALLLDEPLGALDLKLRQQMQIELKRIQREVGITFVYVTHDQGEALTMSDRIAVMNGRARSTSSARRGRSTRRPATRFVAGFIGTSNLLDGDVEPASTDGIALLTYGAGGPGAGAGRRRGRAPATSSRSRSGPRRSTCTGARPPATGGSVLTGMVDRGRLPRHVDQLHRHDGRRRRLRWSSTRTPPRAEDLAERGDRVFLTWSPAALVPDRSLMTAPTSPTPPCSAA